MCWDLDDRLISVPLTPAALTALLLLVSSAAPMVVRSLSIFSFISLIFFFLLQFSTTKEKSLQIQSRQDLPQIQYHLSKELVSL